MVTARVVMARVSLVKVSLVKVRAESLAALMTTPVGMMPAKALSSKQLIRWLRRDSSKP